MHEFNFLFCLDEYAISVKLPNKIQVNTYYMLSKNLLPIASPPDIDNAFEF